MQSRDLGDEITIAKSKPQDNIASNDASEKNDSKTSTMSAENNVNSPDRSTLVQPLLAYTLFSLQSSARENVAKAILGHFAPVDILTAKEALWNFCGTSIIGEWKNRKDSSSRGDNAAHVNDILDAFGKLDKAIRLLQLW